MLPHGHLRTGTLLSHTGHRLSHAGVTEITFSTEKPASILSKSTKAVSLDERIPSDPEVEKIVQQFTGNPFFNQQVGVAGEDITHVTVGTFFCKAIQQASHSAHCHLQLRRRTGQKPSLQGPHQDQGYL